VEGLYGGALDSMEEEAILLTLSGHALYSNTLWRVSISMEEGGLLWRRVYFSLSLEVYGYSNTLWSKVFYGVGGIYLTLCGSDIVSHSVEGGIF
jgi:hypothetical protein